MRTPTLFALLLLAPSLAQARPAAGKAQPRADARPPAPHPLDDLRPDELARVVAAVRPRFSSEARFAVIAAQEPPKRAVLAAAGGGGLPPRRAVAVVYEPGERRLTEVTVELGTGAVEGSRVIPGAQPPVLLGDYEVAAQLVRADARWQAAMAKRGITRFDEVAVDGWAPGPLSQAERTSGGRLLRGLSFLKGPKGRWHNYYGRPIEGVVATVDLGTRRVVGVVDTGVVPVTQANEDLGATAEGTPREAPRPLVATQPKGASYVVEGQAVRWQGWRFRYSMHPQKGLVLYQVGFEETPGEPRPVLYKAALSEMVVPYGAGDQAWSFRNAFDVGEYGLGRAAHSLSPEVDAPPHAAFFDALFADDQGAPLPIPRAVALYERDGGLLWKHVEMYDRSGEGRRARQLVLTFTTTIGNYDYGLAWVFHQDGTLEAEVYLTGILLAKGTPMTANPCEGECLRLVAPRVLAPNHQHFFSFRLDLDVDGADGNTPQELNVGALPSGPDNPLGNAFDVTLTTLRRESEAARDLSTASARKWKVIGARKNALGHPTGYVLVPGEVAVPYMPAAHPVRQRARFVEHAVWFTRYKDEEQGAAGEYPNQSTGGDGLPRYVADDEALEKQDVVLWYTFGVTHVPRPEEWPVMNAHRAGFKLLPMNFFSRNPALKLGR